MFDISSYQKNAKKKKAALRVHLTPVRKQITANAEDAKEGNPSLHTDERNVK